MEKFLDMIGIETEAKKKEKITKNVYDVVVINYKKGIDNNKTFISREEMKQLIDAGKNADTKEYIKKDDVFKNHYQNVQKVVLDSYERQVKKIKEEEQKEKEKEEAIKKVSELSSYIIYR